MTELQDIEMTAERFGHAISVIEAGVETAEACRKCGDSGRETANILASGFAPGELSQTTLLELLSTAIVLLTLERSKNSGGEPDA